jgi:hypothetical protein
LVSDNPEQPFLELPLAVLEFFNVATDAGVFETMIRPVFLVLGIGDVGDLANVRVVFPHLPRNLAMEF